MFKSPTEYLKHILEEIIFLEREVQNYTENRFMRDELKQRAFTRSLEVIGEASKQVPEEFRLEHSQIDWKGLAGLRDKLIHHYFGVDYAIVWDVVTNELPGLKIKLESLLKTI